MTRLLVASRPGRCCVRGRATPKSSLTNLPLAGIVEHLSLRSQTDETSIVRAFRVWVGKVIEAT